MAERAESPAGSPRKQQVSRRAQKLTEDRLARKRELDRQAQRSARVKTKNHIAQLESRIEALTKVQGTGDVRGLIEQIEGQRKEIVALKTTLKTIGKLVGNAPDNGTLKEARAEDNDEKNLPNAHCSSDTEDTAHRKSELGYNKQTDLGGPLNSNELILSNNGNGMGLSRPGLLPNTYPAEALFPRAKTRSPPFFGSDMSHAKMADFPFNIPTAETLVHNTQVFGQSVGHTDWQTNSSACCSRTIIVGSELLSQCSKLQMQCTTSQSFQDEDIAIRAVIHGWSVVTERYSLDPVWTTLRLADAAMFSKFYSSNERLVCMSAVCAKLRYQMNPTSENLAAVPYFAHDRPSQRAIPHHPLIDYLAWPGLRERLVFNPHCYCSEKFETMFWPSFRFVWGHEFRDAYVYNRQTGLYQFSAPFVERSRDLQSFRMIPKFFTEFPELKADIEVAPAQSDPSSLDFDGGLGAFGLTISHEMQPPHNGFLEGAGYAQMDWPGNQVNMRLNEA